MLTQFCMNRFPLDTAKCQGLVLTPSQELLAHPAGTCQLPNVLTRIREKISRYSRSSQILHLRRKELCTVTPKQNPYFLLDLCSGLRGTWWAQSWVQLFLPTLPGSVKSCTSAPCWAPVASREVPGVEWVHKTCWRSTEVVTGRRTELVLHCG